jgi:hypothetical protein
LFVLGHLITFLDRRGGLDRRQNQTFAAT